jgi:hypothetical protein
VRHRETEIEYSTGEVAVAAKEGSYTEELNQQKLLDLKSAVGFCRININYLIYGSENHDTRELALFGYEMQLSLFIKI